MSFEPAKWFLGSVETFGVLLPGSMIVVGARAVAVKLTWLAQRPWPSTTLDWASLLVGGFVAGYLAHPPAHVLNRAYDRTYRSWRGRNGDPLYEYAVHVARSEGGQDKSAYAFVKSELDEKSPATIARVDRMEGISKGFRTISFVSLVLSVAFGISRDGSWAVLLLIVGVLSFLVFSERRYAASAHLYQTFRRIREESKPPNRIITG